MSQKRAKDFAAKHGYKLRKVPHSAANPNGYVKVIAADRAEYRAADWAQAWQTMMGLTYKKQK